MSTSSPQRATSTWNIDPVHTIAEFKVKHMMITNVKGEFRPVTGVLTLDESDVTKSRAEATVEAASINTREADRDTHLKSAGEDELAVEGDLTIRGVSRKVVFAVEGPSAPGKDPWGNTRIGLSAKTKINRKDFGLTWNSALETGGILVGDEVTITLEVQAIKF